MAPAMHLGRVPPARTRQRQGGRRRNTMKRAALYTMVVLALALCPILTQAQTNKLLQANIPFDFTAGNTRMASGVYVIENASSGSHTQLVRNPETKAATFLLSNS